MLGGKGTGIARAANNLRGLHRATMIGCAISSLMACGMRRHWSQNCWFRPGRREKMRRGMIGQDHPPNQARSRPEARQLRARLIFIVTRTAPGTFLKDCWLPHGHLRRRTMRDDLNGTTRGASTGMGSSAWIAIAAVIVVLIIAFMWHPWNGSGIATNNGSNTTVGSSTRPATPTAPTAPSPITPVAPSK